ncbi:MAG: hypothetical protein JW772_05555 [Candidatus Diapherotrites archaeon]|nr:hypothetical protein [Candidatus Diapherotrites archaeon]
MPRKWGAQTYKPRIKRSRKNKPAKPKAQRQFGLEPGAKTKMRVKPGKGVTKFGKRRTPYTAGTKISGKDLANRFGPYASEVSAEQLLKMWKRKATHDNPKYGSRRRH